MAANTACCKDCTYYSVSVKGGMFKSEKGDCRRYPPTIVQTEDSTAYELKSIFPVVLPDEWCGEFRSAE